MFGWWKRRREARRFRTAMSDLGHRVMDRALDRMVSDPEWLKNAATYRPAVISSLPTAISSVPSQGLLRSPE